MRSILMIVTIIFGTILIGCGKDNGGADDKSTTLDGKESTLVNTTKDATSPNKQWKRTKLTLHEGYELVDPADPNREPGEPVELQLCDLSFKHAFSIQYRAKGEGHTFWWRGDEYTTNLEDYGEKVEIEYVNPSVDKE